jgi:Ion channel
METRLLEDNKTYKESRELYLKWRISELISSIFSVLGILTSTIDYEINYSIARTHYNCHQGSNQIFSWITLGLTLVAAFFLFKRHILKVKWYNNRPEQPNHTNKEAIIRRKQIKKKKKVLSYHLFIDLLILFIFPYPNMSFDITIWQAVQYDNGAGVSNTIHLCYTLSEIFYIATFFRLIFLLRSFISFTPFLDDHSRYYCARYNTKANVRFSIRCMLRTSPFFMILSFIIPSFFILGLLLRVFERPYMDVLGLNFNSYLNAVWCCAVTMATIGYGDLYPGTVLGRTVAIICAMWGAFAFSMIVFSLEWSLRLNPDQNKAFHSIVRSRAAAKAISAGLYCNLIKKKYGSRSVQAQKQMQKLRKKLDRFTTTIKKLTRDFRSHKNQDKNKERFKKLNQSMIRIEEKLDKVLNIHN